MQPASPRILTIDGGSSSIKFALFEAGSLERILEGAIERIGPPQATLRGKGLNQADNFSPAVAADHTVAVGAVAGARVADASGGRVKGAQQPN
jgi:acetate kinase